MESTHDIGDDDEEKKKQARPDALSSVFTMIQEYYLNAGQPEWIRLADVRPQIVRRGFKDAEIEKTLEEYQDLSVWLLSQDRERIKFQDYTLV